MGGWPHQEMLGSSQPKPVLKGEDGTEAKPLLLSVRGHRGTSPRSKFEFSDLSTGSLQVLRGNVCAFMVAVLAFCKEKKKTLHRFQRSCGLRVTLSLSARTLIAFCF